MRHAWSRRPDPYSPTAPTMLRDHVTEAIRRLRAHPAPTAVSLVSLSVAFAVAILVGEYVYHETTFDAFHEQGARVRRVVLESPDRDLPTAKLPAAAGPAIAEGVPDVEAVVRIRAAARDLLVEAGPDGDRVSQRRTDILFADGAFGRVFSFPALAGDTDALARPGTVALTESAAQDLFADANPVGESVTLEGRLPLEVVAVFADPPARSSIPFGLVATFDAYRALQEGAGFAGNETTEWDEYAYDTYALVRSPDADARDLAAAAALAVDVRAGDRPIREESVVFEPLGDARLRSRVTDGLSPPGAPAYLVVLVGVALLLLLVAGATYANLTVARSLRSTREVGVRQALGATPGSVAAQYVAEAVLLSAGALLVGLALARLALPAFQAAIDVPVEIRYGSPWIWAGLLALVLLTGGAAGAYPAAVLSRLSPDAALRDRSLLAGARLRKGLVAFQFAATVFLVSCAAVLSSQLHHLQALSLGYEPAGVVVLPLHPGPTADHADALLDAFRALPQVVSATAGTAVPTRFGGPDGSVEPVGEAEGPGSSDDLMQVAGVDRSYAETLGLRLVSGRFLRDTAADSGRSVVLNETAARTLGWSDPVGHQLSYWGGTPRTVVGVVADFYAGSPRAPVDPAVLVPRAEMWADHVAVKLRPGSEGGLDAIERVWARFAEGEPFEGRFLDGAVAEQTHEEARLAAAFGGFALVAVLIACLGLASLVAFAAERRTREIGVRTTLGATDWNVAALLGGEFAPLLALGFALALPAAIWTANRWLDGFASKMVLTPWPFLAAGMLAGALATATIVWRGLRAARVPPARALHAD